MDFMKKKIIIAGGGAAGMSAAILLARKEFDVTILEKNTVLGKKITITGNGRCNLSNRNLSSNFYNESSRNRMDEYIAKYTSKDIVSFYKTLGVLISDEDGYLYPISGQATTIQNALINEITKLGINVIYKSQLKKVTPCEDSLFVKTNDSEYKADYCIIATGGLAGALNTMSTGDGYYIGKMLGANIIDQYPALVSLKSKDIVLPAKSGVRVKAKISLRIRKENSFMDIANESGEIQLTNGSISGIPTMQLSGKCARLIGEGKEVYLHVDFLPEYNDEEFAELENLILNISSGKKIIDILDGIGNHNLAVMILDKLGIDKDERISDKDSLKNILRVYKDYNFKIDATGDYKSAQVTSGGIDLESLTSSLSLKNHDNIYFAGEVLDVDGKCGGYNLQWAFTSACICANSIIEKVSR